MSGEREKQLLAEMIAKINQHALDELPFARDSLRLYYGDLADHREIVGAIARRKAELLRR